MLDLSYFQNSGNVNTQTFTNAGSWVTWCKPRGAKFISVFCIGAGAGGGGGLGSGSVGTTAGGAGGAGGGSGGYVRAQFDAAIIPSTLYIYTGVGGAGGIGGTGAAGTSGSSGELSYVSIHPDTGSASNIMCRSSNTVAVGGPGGIFATDTVAAGAAATVVTTGNAIFLNLGNFLGSAGRAGASGIGNSQGGNITVSVFLTGGAGGGGTRTSNTAYSGGNIAGAGPVPTLSGGAGTTTTNATAGRGADGVALYKPILFFTGGAGGGSSKGTGGIGGNGGNGSYGCGGGGGGAGTLTGGNGGRGGDGIVLITTSF